MLASLAHLIVLFAAQPLPEVAALPSPEVAALPSPEVAALPSPAELPRCGSAIERCAALRVWVAPQADFADAAFLTAQLEQAQRHHAPAGLAFEVVEVRALSPAEAHIQTRAERDALGHRRWQRGLIDVYLVSALANVDAPGEIRGVHWRSRADRQRRWIIVSRISAPHVLAHELGHYFGLAHSKVPASLMNTSTNALPERTFQPDELTRIARRAKRLFAQQLVRDPRPPPSSDR